MIGNKFIKTGLPVIALSMLLQVPLAFVRVFFGIEISTIIGFIAYYVGYLIAARIIQIHFGLIFIFATVGLLVLQLPIRLVSFDSTSLTLLEFLCQFFGLLISWLASKYTEGNKKILAFGISLFLVIPFSVYGNKFWFYQRTYGSFTGAVSYGNVNIDGIDEKELAFSTSNHHGKTIVLDFWHSKCAACFIAFPKLDALNKKYSYDKNILILAVNYPLKSDKANIAFDLIHERNYSFKTIVLKNVDVLKKINVSFFPTTCIIDKKGNIIFSGDIEQAEKALVRYLEGN